jgi:hypothetical protein
MGRHHSFLDSLKDFGHKVENTVKSAAPQVLSTVQTASKFTPVGIVAAIATNPVIDKAVVGGFNKVGSSVKGALDNVKNEAVSIEKGAVGLVKSGINEVEGGLSYIKYIPYVAGGILAIWVYSKVK